MVVIVGGYASFPAGVAAVLTRVPLVSVTTDAVPGAVNGLLGRFAAANAVAFAGTDLPRAHVTGHAGAARARHAGPLARGPGAPAGPRSACPPTARPWRRVGGSLGAGGSTRPWPSWRDLGRPPDRALYHVTGRRDYEAFALARAGHGRAGR